MLEIGDRFTMTFEVSEGQNRHSSSVIAFPVTKDGLHLPLKGLDCNGFFPKVIEAAAFDIVKPVRVGQIWRRNMPHANFDVQIVFVSDKFVAWEVIALNNYTNQTSMPVGYGQMAKKDVFLTGWKYQSE